MKEVLRPTSKTSLVAYRPIAKVQALRSKHRSVEQRPPIIHHQTDWHGKLIISRYAQGSHTFIFLGTSHVEIGVVAIVVLLWGHVILAFREERQAASAIVGSLVDRRRRDLLSVADAGKDLPELT